MLVYDNFKSHIKQGFMLSLENTFLETPRGSGEGGVNLTTARTISLLD